MRYFFDILTGNTVQHDFQGRVFATLEHAHSLAELIALDMECSDLGKDAFEVVVRDAKGSLLFSVNMRPPDLIAA